MLHVPGTSSSIAAIACLRHMSLPSPKAFAARMPSIIQPPRKRMPTSVYLAGAAGEPAHMDKLPYITVRLRDK